MTSSILAVFERIDLTLLEALLSAAAGESALQLVSFTNQPPGAGASVPGARIAAHCSASPAILPALARRVRGPGLSERACAVALA